MPPLVRYTQYRLNVPVVPLDPPLTLTRPQTRRLLKQRFAGRPPDAGMFAKYDPKSGLIEIATLEEKAGEVELTHFFLDVLGL